MDEAPETDDEYLYPSINPERKRRFFRYLVLEHKFSKKERAKQNREKFVRKIDTLRSIAHVKELKKEPQNIAPKNEKEIEEKINKLMSQEKIIQELKLEHEGIVSNISDIRGLISKIEQDHNIVLNLQNSLKEIDKQLKEGADRKQLSELSRKVNLLEQELLKMEVKKQQLTPHEKVVEQKVLEQKPKVDIKQLHKRREKLLEKISELKQKKKK